jgi:hypothetical protein
MRPIFFWGLPTMGIFRTFPQDIVFAPKLYMGLGFKHLHTEQELQRMKDIPQHLRHREALLYCLWFVPH